MARSKSVDELVRYPEKQQTLHAAMLAKEEEFKQTHTFHPRLIAKNHYSSYMDDEYEDSNDNDNNDNRNHFRVRWCSHLII